MIIDSNIWKKDLSNEIVRITDYFKRIDFEKHNDEEYEDDDDDDDENDLYNQAFIKLQKFTIYTAVVVRKLIESNKVSDELIAENFSIHKFDKKTKRKVSIIDAYEIEKFYDLENPIKINTSLRLITDRFIHSFHFMPKYDWQKIDETKNEVDSENWSNKGLIGIYISSDNSKEKYLEFIELKTYIAILKKVLSDRVMSMQLIEGKVVKKSNKANS